MRQGKCHWAHFRDGDTEAQFAGDLILYFFLEISFFMYCVD